VCHTSMSNPNPERSPPRDEDMTFSEFVIRQRLARAWRILVDPRFVDRSVTSVAFDCGFGDLSYFNRTFRRQFGCTPSDRAPS
jgi:AraC-like DNA-binding protein